MRTKSQTNTDFSGLQTTVLQTNNSIDESVMSTVSSVWGGDDREIMGSPATENWEVPSTQILEQLSNGDSRGSHKSEIQLRYQKPKLA